MKVYAMKLKNPEHPRPDDSAARQAIEPVICYSPETLPSVDVSGLRDKFDGAKMVDQIEIAPRDGGCIAVPAGGFFRIKSVQGPQVGDLNLWNLHDLTERFYSGKTRALHGTHVSTGDRMWSTHPHMRPLATIIRDTLDWYGFDDFGGSVHDVIGTRCDPYTGRLLSGDDYHYCCHSNLTRALAQHQNLPLHEAEMLVHDVMNIFMCTGFTRDTGQYFMKASPVRPGDHVDFLAEIDLLVGLSACPGGDCASTHTSDAAQCHPLVIEVWDPGEKVRRDHIVPLASAYDRTHGV